MMFCNDVEKRWYYIHEMLNIIIPSDSPKTKYLVKYNPYEQTNGKAVLNGVLCTLNQRILAGPYLVPYVHEEVHVIVKKQWPNLPSFWNEALAEYALMNISTINPTKKNNIFLSKIYAKMLENRSDYKDLLWTLDDCSFWTKCRAGETGYIVAAYLVKLIIDQYGIEFMHVLLEMINTNNNVFFADFIIHENIVNKWFKDIYNTLYR